MSINLVVLDGVASHLALRYDEYSRAELRFTLTQTDHATDGKPWTSYWPCCAAGGAAERLAEEIHEGQHIVVTSGKLCYRKRDGKAGPQSRLEILVWHVERITESTQDDSASGGSVSLKGQLRSLSLSQMERRLPPRQGVRVFPR